MPNSGGQPLSGVPVLANPNETGVILGIGKPVHLSGMRSLRPSLSLRRSTSAHAAGYIQTSDGTGAPRINIAWPSCPCRSHKQPEPRGRAEGRVSRRCVRHRVRVQEEGGGSEEAGCPTGATTRVRQVKARRTRVAGNARENSGTRAYHWIDRGR